MFKLAGVIFSHICGFSGTTHGYEKNKKIPKLNKSEIKIYTAESQLIFSRIKLFAIQFMMCLLPKLHWHKAQQDISM